MASVVLTGGYWVGGWLQQPFKGLITAMKNTFFALANNKRINQK